MLKKTETALVPASSIFVDYGANCRDFFTPQSCNELAESIRTHGLQYPLDVQPAEEAEFVPDDFDYRLITGHRRYTAMLRILQWDQIPVTIRYDLTPEEVKILNIVENIERKNLSLAEESKALHSIFPPDTSLRKISKTLNRSFNWCCIRWRFLTLPRDIQAAVARGELNLNDVRILVEAEESKRESMASELLLARQQGQKTVDFLRKKGRRAKNLKAIQAMLVHLQLWEKLPHPYDALLWAAGEISDNELLESKIK